MLLNLFKKVWPWALLLVLLGFSYDYIATRIANRHLLAEKDKIIQVNEHSQATIAMLRRQNNELRLANRAAKDMGGKLVGGVKLSVRRDTIKVDRKPVETLEVDSIRYAQHKETTPDGDITVDVWAPRYPHPIEIGLLWEPVPFEPEVGLVQKGDNYYWVVSWKGQTVTPKEAFFRPPRGHKINFVVGGSVISTQDNRVVTFSVSPYAGIDYTLKKDLTLGADAGINIPNLGTYFAASLEKRIGGIF